MIDDAAKANLYDYLKHEREAVLATKLDGLSEYDVRRPLTVTGTNLLGLVKHLATWEARYLGEVFDRRFPNLCLGGTSRAERLRRHVGERARVPQRRCRPLPTRVGPQRRDGGRPRPRCHRPRGPGGRTPVLFPLPSFICLPRPVGTPATLTSCAKSSTERWEPTPRPWPWSTTQPSGRSGARRSRRAARSAG